jgi:hypothetical protein
MSCKSIVIDGVEYKPQADSGNDIRIVVLQRGWVLVGRYSKDGDDCKLLDASVIRQWGTSKGIGELALNGPLEATKLDPTSGPVEFHRLTEIMTIKCEASKWATKLK